MGNLFFFANIEEGDYMAKIIIESKQTPMLPTYLDMDDMIPKFIINTNLVQQVSKDSSFVQNVNIIKNPVQ